MKKYLYILIPLFLPITLYFLYWFLRKEKGRMLDSKAVKNQWYIIISFVFGVVFLSISLFFFSKSGMDNKRKEYISPQYINPIAPPIDNSNRE